MFEIFHYPFMQRAFITGIFLAALLAYLGVFVVLRRMAFFSDGIAHASLAGVAVGVLLSLNPLVTALIASVIFGVIMFFLERKTNLSSDTVIGLIFTSGMALGVLLMSLKRGYQPELISFLFGNILMIRPADLILIVVLSLLTGIFLAANHRRITLLALDREMAYLAGVNPDFLHLVMYVVLAMSVVLGIKILGVVLVSALLIIPVSISKLISRSFRRLMIWSIILAELIVSAGLVFSYLLDLPAGAVVVLTGAAVFLLVLTCRSLFQKEVSG
ncbi:MAG: metal ABC transporter permease [Candidatus Omnitrophica bacterium]|nr:metal ABC transporter permease [Candidatus Omnitrophota bacterium]